MMDFRKKLFIIIGIVLGLIIALVLFLLYFRSPENPTDEITPPNVTETGGTVSQPATPVVPVQPTIKPAEVVKPTIPPAEFYVKQLSGIFIERFLSYSNQNDNQHLDDVLNLTTEKMSKWVMLQKVQPSNEYQGVNTTVVASSIKEITANKAIVLVGVQRVYEGIENKIEYKNGRVELVKVGQEWKVDGFYWE